MKCRTCDTEYVEERVPRQTVTTREGDDTVNTTTIQIWGTCLCIDPPKVFLRNDKDVKRIPD